MAHPPSTATPVVEVRALRESDLVAATHVMQRAFGTFLGAPDPDRFMADRNYVRSRWRADPTSALVAVVDGKVVGSNRWTDTTPPRRPTVQTRLLRLASTSRAFVTAQLRGG